MGPPLFYGLRSTPATGPREYRMTYTTTITLANTPCTLKVWHDNNETVVGVYCNNECVQDLLYVDVTWQEALAQAITLHWWCLITA